MEEERLRINVRTLAEFYFEGGDLVSGRGMIQRMLEGTRAHRLAQGGYEPGWQSEAALRMELERRGVKLLLHGRADGLLAAGDDSVIEEIKSMLEDTAGMEGGEYPVHWAQAELYAAMLAARDGLLDRRAHLVRRHGYSPRNDRGVLLSGRGLHGRRLGLFRFFAHLVFS